MCAAYVVQEGWTNFGCEGWTNFGCEGKAQRGEAQVVSTNGKDPRPPLPTLSPPPPPAMSSTPPPLPLLHLG